MVCDLLCSLGRKEQAIRLLIESPDFNSNPSLAKKVTLIEISDLPPEEAKQELEALLALPEFHDDTQLQVALSKLRRSLGQNPDSIHDLRQSLALHPGDSYLLLQLALALRENGDTGEALTILEALFRQDPRNRSCGPASWPPSATRDSRTKPTPSSPS